MQDTINTLNSQYKGTVFDLTENDYKRIRYKSIYVSWKPLVDFSWSVIREKEIGYKSANSMSECVFVDMAEIWESFLRKKLGEGFADDGWRALSVEECTYQIYKGKFYQRDIIPDIILEREQNGQKEYMVFDAKYKRMRGIKSSLKYSDVDRSDLFQIHTYIQYVQNNMGKVVIGGLLYPITQKGKDDDGTEFENPDIDEESYHTNHLFGDDGKDNTPPFIIDGILCPEVEDDNPHENEDVQDQLEELEETLNDLASLIKDEKLEEMIADIDTGQNDFGLYEMQVVISYICDNYQPHIHEKNPFPAAFPAAAVRLRAGTSGPHVRARRP